jgi:hypothetical protein
MANACTAYGICYSLREYLLRTVFSHSEVNASGHKRPCETLLSFPRHGCLVQIGFQTLEHASAVLSCT